MIQGSGLPLSFTPTVAALQQAQPQNFLNTSSTLGVPNFANQLFGGSAALTPNIGGNASNAVMAIAQLTASLTGLLQQLASLTGQVTGGSLNLGSLPTLLQQLPLQQVPVQAQPATSSKAVTPDEQTARVLLNAYVDSASPTTPDLDVRRLMQESGNKGISSLALGYGSEIKAAAATLAQNPNTTFNGVTNRATNPAGLLPFMSFNSSGADQFLEAMMVYKNGTYNNGVFGQYDLPNIVNTYEQLAGPLTPEARQNALVDERIGMGLVYKMMAQGLVDPSKEIRTDGSSVHGFWPNTPRNSSAYLNAFKAVSSGTLASDLALEEAGRGDETLGKVDAYLNANRLGLNLPEKL